MAHRLKAFKILPVEVQRNACVTLHRKDGTIPILHYGFDTYRGFNWMSRDALTEIVAVKKEDLFFEPSGLDVKCCWDNESMDEFFADTGIEFY